MAGTLSGLTTRGRCLLAAGFAAALCSAVLDERDLLRVSAFVIGLPLLAALLAARSRVGLRAERRLLPGRVPVGGNTTVSVTLHSTGRVPTGGLLLEDNVPYSLGGKPRFVVERLHRHGGTSLQYPLRPGMRGVHQVGPLKARVTDPFGLAEYDRELAGSSRLVVVPQVSRLNGLPGGSGLGAGDDGSVRLRAGQGEDDAVVRQYRHGDDLRKVHWRSTARRDELMVRVEEMPWRGGTAVLLDHRASAHAGGGPTASLEWAISFAGSVCLHLHRFGYQVKLVSEDGRVLAGGTGDGGHSDDVVLDSLAALQASHRRDLSCVTDPGGGHELIAVLGALTPAAAAELIKFRPRGARSLAVLMDTAAWAGESAQDTDTDPEKAARVLRDAGWSVTVAGPKLTMNEVWGAVCRANSARGTLRVGEGG